MNLRIIKAGILDTVQDLGRNGWQHLGINPCGVMDKVSAQLANSLVGNNPNEAVVELHFPASAFFFEQPAMIALSGADFSASVNGEEVPGLHPILVSKYSILQFHRVQAGARAYMAVHGGLDIPLWLNSYSTQLKAGAGGFMGRALQKDDEIKLRYMGNLFAELLGKKEFEILSWKLDDKWDKVQSDEVLALPGNEWQYLNQKSKDRFLTKPFTITNHSDRMGYHLQGKSLASSLHEELVSSAVTFGTVQLLPEGQPILLMADHQTAGGYPRIAHVISAHHSRIAQLKPGEMIRFQFTDPGTAEKLFIGQQQRLSQLHTACMFKLEEFLNARH
jgi:antagonist of KipI